MNETGLQSILDKYYKQERNVKLESFWDGGWIVMLGDELNGYTAESAFDTLEEVTKFLEDML
jgi:hypothetical protein